MLDASDDSFTLSPQTERVLITDAMCSRLMLQLSGGAFIVALALQFGASNLVIGLLAAIAPACQVLQIPAIYLVEKSQSRKRLTIVLALLGRAMLLGIAGIPFLLPEEARLPAFLGLLVLHYALGAVSACGFSSWVRDLIPDDSAGAFFSKALTTSTAVGAAATLLSAFGVDALSAALGSPATAYAILFGTAGIIGLLGSLNLTRLTEPQRPPAESTPFLKMLTEPLRDGNFRALLIFNFIWNFSLVMAGAFFAVYMFERIGLSVVVVMGLSVAGQVTTMIFYSMWGRIADRFNNKSVLLYVSPIFLFTIFLFPFTTLPDPHSLTIWILIVIHVLGGFATAGFALCSGNLALKLAPRGKATAYMAGNAFISGIGSTLGPIVGGIIGGYFEEKRLSLSLAWFSDSAGEAGFTLPTFDLQGADFVFIAAVITGFISLLAMQAIHETGTVDEDEVREQVQVSIRQVFVTLSTVVGIRKLTEEEKAFIRQRRAERQRARAARRGETDSPE